MPAIASKVFDVVDMRAILNGTKTAFAVPIEPQPAGVRNVFVFNQCEGDRNWSVGGADLVECPFKKGERFWIKEPFALTIFDFEEAEPYMEERSHWTDVVYEADGDSGDWCLDIVDSGVLVSTPINAPWVEAERMPRWASRGDIEIVSARAYMLNAMSESYAKSLGAIPEPNEWDDRETGEYRSSCTHLSGFMMKWESQYGGSRFAWNNNPLIWIVTFDFIER